jgi:hypothetical protein
MKNKRVELDQYLSSYNEQIDLLARDVRNMILELVPEMDEVIKGKIFSMKRMDLFVPLYHIKTMLICLLEAQNLKILQKC